MKQTIHFTKMHGAGNDYIYVNTLLYNIPDPSAASIAWSKPHFGIGSDGLILIGKATTPEADFSMRIFNNDGSEAMMCGNGTRCVAKFLHDKGMTDKNPIRLQTLSGIKVLQLHLDSDNVVEAVTVDMGEPILQQPEQFAANNGAARNHPVTVDGRTFHGTFVSMGNPHFVIFLEEDDVDAFPIDHYGSLLEKHPLFPQRCNIEFVSFPSVVGQSPDAHNVAEKNTTVFQTEMRMRVWERGSGITLACGTGACATAVAACLTGRAERWSKIQMDGGTLQIRWNDSDNHILMTGPAAISFEGTLTL